MRRRRLPCITSGFSGADRYSITEMTPNGNDSEQQLTDLVRSGDHAAMKTMYSTYIRYLTAVCSRYIPNDEDVKDVLQDIFIKAFAAMPSFEYRGNGSLKGWLTRLTVNQALKFLQRNRRIEFTDISADDHDIPDEDPDIDPIPSSEIFKFIRELPDGYRTIFNLYVIENRTHREIAAMLNIKESTSASQLHRAKALLAAKLKHYTNNI